MSAAPEFTQYVPPHSLEAEMCTLGAMLLSEKACDEVLHQLKDLDFYSPAHREIYRSIQSLNLQGRAVDIVTVKNELIERNLLIQAGGTEYLLQVAESVPSPGYAKHYAEIVLDKSTMRRLDDAGQSIIKLAHDTEKPAKERIDEAESMIFEINKDRLGREMKPIRSLAKDFFIKIDEFYDTGEPLRGIPSGYYDLDEMTGGFFGSDLLIVAARPAMGKTSLVLNFALNVAAQQKGNVAIFSIEMSGEQLVRRMLSMLSQTSMGILKKDKLYDDDYQKLADACETLYGLPIHIDDSSEISPLEMRGKCRRLKAEGGLSLVVIDYLQLMKGSRKTENRVQEISDIARGLKTMAKELEVPVIALSQLNRGVESRDDKRPMLSDLRESGSIEAEADMVMMIYRDAYYKAREIPEDEQPVYDPNRVEEAELIIAKHRNGPTGTVRVGFQPSYARFVNLQM
ncbi:MAG: replicative DNA helicase [Armatimonadetes bacterium]|nr:replicative DNA helicase [Armatimonadota bacterium]